MRLWRTERGVVEDSGGNTEASLYEDERDSWKRQKKIINRRLALMRGVKIIKVGFSGCVIDMT